MASQTVLKGLVKRMAKSIPLSTLNQGASLSIKSQVPLQSLQIISQWRDDGYVDVTQTCDTTNAHNNDNNLLLCVSKLQDRVTSLGRPASHVALNLQLPPQKKDDSNAESSTTSDNQLDESTEIHHLSPVSQGQKSNAETEHEDSNKEPGVHVSVVVPEKVNLDVRLEHGGNILVPQKVEGDVKLSTSNGSIKVKKLRGHKVRLKSFGDNALVYASSLLEAQDLSVKSSGRFRAKQVHASSIDVRIISHNNNDESLSFRQEYHPLEQDDDAALVDVSSLYVSGQGGATLSVQSANLKRKAVRVKTNHGPVRVKVEGVSQPTDRDPHTNEIYPLVELGGVNGNFELTTQNTTMKDEESWKSCLVHVDSLAPDSVSLLSADVGDISLTVDRKVESDVRFLSTSSRDCLTEASAMLAEEEDSELVLQVVRNIPLSPSDSIQFASEPNVDIATKAFTESSEGSFQSSHVHYIDGWVENNSAEPPSRFDRKVRGETAMGKINLESAKDQALHGFGENPEEDETSKDYPRPLMAIVGTSSIRLETVSWLGAIARRYGLDESGRDLGRQATRKGRPLQPPPQNQ